MRLARHLFLLLSSLLLVGGVVAAVALPGPQRMACPTCFGLEKAADNVYVDSVLSARQRTQTLQSIDRARRQVREFFGGLKSDPRIVVCRTRACAQIFGSKGAKGVAYGWQGILLTNSRIFGVIAAHELAHVELHWRMGLLGWARGTVPAWFDEGLATVISNDPRFKHDASPKAVREIMKVNSYLGQWAKHVEKVGWRTAYGASATRVRKLERAIGRDGLKRFVDRLVREGDLSILLRKVGDGNAF